MEHSQPGTARRGGRRLLALALAGALVVGCSGGDGEGAAAASTAPPATRAPAPLGAVELPPLEFAEIDDEGTVATDITAEALFDLNSAALKAEADTVVEQLAARLDLAPSAVRIDGYTDGLGDTDHNLALSRQRAEALAARIRALGTATSVLACGRGEEGSDGESAAPELRRVVVTISTGTLDEECP